MLSIYFQLKTSVPTSNVGYKNHNVIDLFPSHPKRFGCFLSLEIYWIENQQKTLHK